MKKKIISIILSIFILSNFINSNQKVFAEPKKTNNQFINSYIKPNIKITSDKNSNNLLKSTVLPAKYDLREQGLLTQIKNQGSLGDCWAFGAMASLESNKLKTSGKMSDYSEINMALYNGRDLSINEGGNYQMATAYLARWEGPIDEEIDPYPSPATLPNLSYRGTFTPKEHVQNVVFLPDRLNSLDNDNLKRAVVDYGAVMTSMYVDQSLIKSNGAYYYNLGNSSNHAINIIGWDDNYSKYNFISAPSGDGAFICRNSWGTSYGDGGYLYISYYDTAAFQDNAAFMSPEPINNYDNIYQYDPLGIGGHVSYNNSSMWGANVFTAKDTGVNGESLNAVSFYTIAENTTYSIYVEESYDANGFNNIKNKLASTGTISSPGYHTVKLSTKYNLGDNKKFAVAVNLQSSSATKFIYEYRKGEPSESNSNESYISSNGTSWQDISLSYGNLCLKAFTDIIYTVPVTSLSLNEETLSIKPGDNYLLNPTISPSNAINKKVLWESSDEKIATVDDNGLINGIKEGQVSITATSFDGSFKDTVIINVEYNIKPQATGSVSFTSIFLEKAVRDSLNIPSGPISSLQMKNLITLNIENKNIESLKGLEYGENITSLTIKGAKLKGIEELAYLGKLNYLHLENNSLWCLTPLENLHNLNTLYLDNNVLQDITSLKTISLNIKNSLGALKAISISGNYINLQNSAITNDLSYISANVENINYLNQKQGIPILYANPYNGEINFNSNEDIKISFLNNIYPLISDIDLNKIKLYTITSEGNKYVDISPSISNNILTIKPSNNLENSKTYSILIPKDVLEDSLGVTNKEDFYLNFGTSSFAGDISGDSIIDIKDLAIVSQNYGVDIFSSSWDDNHDLNKDGRINLFDLIKISTYLN